MRLIAKIKDVLQDKEGSAIVTLKADNYYNVNAIRNLDDTKDYQVEIKEIKSKRSLEQNRMMWKLISQIDKEVNGERSNDEWGIYCQALERAGARVSFIWSVAEAEEMLRDKFRGVQRLNKVTIGNKEGYMYKVYEGSSKMNTKEMTNLIETVMDMALEAGVPIAEYEMP